MGRREYIPTPEEIEAACKAIREERQERIASGLDRPSFNEAPTPIFKVYKVPDWLRDVVEWHNRFENSFDVD